MTSKPEGYTTVSPYLILDSADRTIAFLKDVLGAVELRRIPTEDGAVMHAEVRIDDTVLMLADSPNGQPTPSAHIHVYVDDVDTTYKHALEAGATSVQEPAQKDDEEKRGGVQGPSGTTWWFSTLIAG